MDEDAARDWTLMIDSQRGIVGNPQTRQAGISRKAVRHRLESGQWRRIHRGVYATFTGEAPREARLWAAVKRVGPGAMLSHETAAELHGLTDRPSREIHITVPHSRRPAQNGPIQGIVVHRSDQSRPLPLPEWQLPRTRADDTVLDLVVAAVTFEEAYGWVSRALSGRLVTVGTLRETLDARKRMRWRAWLTEALTNGGEGALLPLERRYAHDVERAHGLPSAQRHHKDNWYEEYGVGVEVEGPACQRAGNRGLAVDGVQAYRFGPVNVTERACESAAMVAASLRRNGWQGQPHPCRRPGCEVGPGGQ